MVCIALKVSTRNMTIYKTFDFRKFNRSYFLCCAFGQVATHTDGNRERYFANDDKFSLSDLVQSMTC